MSRFCVPYKNSLSDNTEAHSLDNDLLHVQVAGKVRQVETQQLVVALPGQLAAHHARQVHCSVQDLARLGIALVQDVGVDEGHEEAHVLVRPQLV